MDKPAYIQNSTVGYKNMSFKESIEFHFSHPYPSPPNYLLTVGPNSKLTKSCQETFDGPYLTFDSIKWNDIFVIDMKIEAFLTGFAQKVLNKSIFNKHGELQSNQKLLIQLHVGQSHEESEEIIQEAFDYFNQINSAVIEQFQIHNRKKIIYLEYMIFDDQTIYLNLLTNMKTDMFYDIEIHTVHKLTSPYYPYTHLHTIIEKWSVRQYSNLYGHWQWIFRGGPNGI